MRLLIMLCIDLLQACTSKIIVHIYTVSVIFVHFIQWLEKTFLKYLEDWEKSVDARVGFSKAEKNKMMLSAETRLGLKFTGILNIT